MLKSAWAFLASVLMHTLILVWLVYCGFSVKPVLPGISIKHIDVISSYLVGKINNRGETSARAPQLSTLEQPQPLGRENKRVSALHPVFHRAHLRRRKNMRVTRHFEQTSMQGFLIYLSKAIERHKLHIKKPVGVSGRVRVRFQINPNQTISHIQVIHTSGSVQLDAFARNLLATLPTLKFVHGPHWIKQAITIEVPIQVLWR